VGDGLSDGGELGACWGDGWEDWGREGVYCTFDVGAAYFCAERGGDGVDAAFCFYEFRESAGMDLPSCGVVEAILGILLVGWLSVLVPEDTRIV
jgi:hypothetical protein